MKGGKSEAESKSMSETAAMAMNAPVTGAESSNGAGNLAPEQAIVLQDQIVDVLRTCYDPEIPINIYDLGLIYEVKVEGTGDAIIRMTLTAPSCPAAQSLPAEIEYKVKQVKGLASVKIDLVWEPPWDQSRMSEAARLQLGIW